MVKPRLGKYWIGLLALMVPSWVVAQVSSLPFSVPAGAGATFISGGTTAPTSVGFARIVANPGSTAPDAFGILEYRQGGILISEAAIPASVPKINHFFGERFFVEVDGTVNTGVAIANPNSEPATISFGFQDPVTRLQGAPIGEGSFIIPPNSQIARFINEPPFNSPAPYFGLMFLTSSIPVSVTALRGLTNERSEFLVTPVVIGEPSPGTFGSVVTQPRITAGFIPRFVDGGDWSTEIVLIDRSGADFGAVTLDFIGPSGEPVPVTIEGQTSSTFDISIEPRNFIRIRTDGAGGPTRAGYVRITAREHSAAFAGFALYSYRESDVTVSTASFPMVQPGDSFQLFVEQSQIPDLLRTGIAISNASPSTSIAFLELINEDGVSTGLTSAVQIPAFGHFAMFLNEIPGFTTVPFPFRGILRVTTNTPEGIVLAGVRANVNERSDFLVASILPTVESDQGLAAERVLPQVVQGSGYSTEIVLQNSRSVQSTGSINTVSTSGETLNLQATSP